MDQDEMFMNRALELATYGEGFTSPNPQVGAVLVARGRIIGEGYHARHGEPHAEVRSIASVSEEDRHLIRESTLYVTLEPCCTYGRTPPCSDLIIKEGIPRVVISSGDQSPGIDGRSVSLLRKKGIDVKEGVLNAQGRFLAARRNIYVTGHRPYILLKYAMSLDGFIGKDTHQVMLSNAASWRLVHRLRQSMDAIMVGTGTVRTDNPQLTNRLFWGKEPVRVIPDLHGRLDMEGRVFQGPAQTWIFRSSSLPAPPPCPEHIRYLLLDTRDELLPQMLRHLADEGITGLLVEGGTKLLRSFLAADLWDEAVVSSCQTFISEGIPNPGFLEDPEDRLVLGDNTLYWFRHPRYRTGIR
jgi:diaminohydroxyphosphoribosylaminopyrimidine deaminase / 5-amino-6-(5-phosphoribosylamino)uracil reductase